MLAVALTSWLTLTPTAPAAEGFFRVEQRNGKWFLIDPAGKPFHMRGCNHYSNGTLMPWNLKERYDNDPAKWEAELLRRHRDWGFTFLAPSIGPVAIDPATVPSDAGGEKKTRHRLARMDYGRIYPRRFPIHSVPGCAEGIHVR